MADAVGATLVLAGAVVMALNLFRFRSVLGALPFVEESTRQHLHRLIYTHGALIGFFLAGYVGILFAFAAGSDFLSVAFVGVIFAAGAVFVYMGLSIQSRLVAALLQTMGRLVPICASCRRIRLPGPEGAPAEWQAVDLRFGQVHESVFTHSICPACEARAFGPADVAPERPRPV